MRPSFPVCKAKPSSKNWLARQFRDPYVQQRMAAPAHYRSRSAFKLLEMDAQYRLLERSAPPSAAHPPQRPRVIVDLGAAPGGWSQVLALKCGYTRHLHPPQGEPADMQHYGLSPAAQMARQGPWSERVVPPDAELPHPSDPPPAVIIALDRLRIPPIPGVSTIQADFLSPTAAELIRAHLPHDTPAPGVDLLLSDMAANATGNTTADVANSLQICEAVAHFAQQHLRPKSSTGPGGTLVLKHFVHPDTRQFFDKVLKPSFRRVYRVKPPSSRAESAECYWVCFGWCYRPPRERPPPPSIPIDPLQPNLPFSPN